MPKFTGFAKVPIRGPKPFPMVGAFANILRFFGDPVGRMMALSREFGNIAAVSDGNPALICAFGAEVNREVLTKSALFQHDTDFPYRTPPGSALATISRMLVFLNGDRHRRHCKLMQPAFAKASLDGYGRDIIQITDEVLKTWPVRQTADVALLLRQLIVSIVLRCLYGLTPSRQADELGTIITQMLDAVTSPAAIAFPFQIPGTPYRKLCQALLGICGNALDQHLEMADQALDGRFAE